MLSGTWKLPAIPPDCEFDWVRSMLLYKKAQAGACVSDAVDIQGAETVAYGTGVRWHDITCYSEKAGLSCRNTDSDAGFTVSRTAYSLT